MEADFYTHPLERAFPEPAQPVPTPPSRENLKAILSALKAVEAGLREPLQVSDLAAAAGYSLFHFTRLFNRIVHHSPFDYLIRRRLSQAALDLQEADARILDIALTYQFNSHESFTRAFRRMFGTPPSQCRGRKPDPHLVLDPIDTELLGLLHSGSLLIRQVTLPELSLAGLMTHSEDPDIIPARLREHLHELLKADSNQPEQQCILRMYSPGWYIYGLQVMYGVFDSPGSNSALVRKTLPPGIWASFSCPYTRSAAPLLRRFIYQTWLPGWLARLREPVDLQILHAPGRSPSAADATFELFVPVIID